MFRKPEIIFMENKIIEFLEKDKKQGLDIDFIKKIVSHDNSDDSELSEITSDSILCDNFSINEIDINKKNSIEFEERYSLLVRSMYMCIKYEISFLQSVKNRHIFVTNQILLKNIKNVKKKETNDMMDYVREIYKETKGYTKYFLEFAIKYNNKIQRLDKLYEILEHYINTKILANNTSLLSLIYPYYKVKKAHLEQFG